MPRVRVGCQPKPSLRSSFIRSPLAHRWLGFAPLLSRFGGSFIRLASSEKLKNTIGMDGFWQELHARPLSEKGLCECFGRGVTGEEEYSATGIVLANVIGKLDAAHRTHHYIRDHRVRVELFCNLNRGFGTVSGNRLVSGSRQDLHKTVGDPHIVIDNQYTKALTSIRHGDPDSLICISSKSKAGYGRDLRRISGRIRWCSESCRGQPPRQAGIEAHESNAVCGRIRPEGEVICSRRRVHKQRIGKQRARVLSLGLPLFERERRDGRLLTAIHREHRGLEERLRRLSAAYDFIEVDVVIEFEIARADSFPFAVPVAVLNGIRVTGVLIEIEDVVFED